MKQLLLLSLTILGFASCTSSDDPEPLNSAVYMIDNGGTTPLLIRAEKGNQAIQLLDSIISPQSKERFYVGVVTGSASLLPTSFFDSFFVYDRTPGGDQLYYSGVRDSDWVQESFITGTTNVTIRIK